MLFFLVLIRLYGILRSNLLFFVRGWILSGCLYSCKDNVYLIFFNWYELFFKFFICVLCDNVSIIYFVVNVVFYDYIYLDFVYKEVVKGGLIIIYVFIKLQITDILIN